MSPENYFHKLDIRVFYFEVTIMYKYFNIMNIVK